ncbi:hypothetical protein NQ318_015796 [Aromia moschata]|uniref:Transposase n=1 Tax=Aromia moschata TaxID=1265417 RepID=A0AAV8XGM8_9CUCU|nr:hypothetical protein NQ318_015796 [Aromia moschata]
MSAGFLKKWRVFHYEKNHHEWGDANQRATVTRHSQFRFKINIWVGMLGNNVLGAVELPSNLNSVNYFDFLKNGLPDLLDDVPLQDGVNMWFMQDGAAPHYALLVRQWLEENCPKRWIGRCVEAPQFCPPRSPDLSGFLFVG